MKSPPLIAESQPRTRLAYLSDFESISPRFRSKQDDLIRWLSEAHAQAPHPRSLSPRERHGVREDFASQFARYGASAEQITTRAHELEDFTHTRWNEMRLFGPAGSDLAAKTRFFEERSNARLEQLYPVDAAAPEAIVHVTCTGYTSPSAAQRVVSLRNWGRATEVVHAYHMGCYAAHPALRMAAGLNKASGVDVVHTELCSLHWDPSEQDPSHLVIQSLFADGFIRYRVQGSGASEVPHEPGFEVLAARDEILPESSAAMAWSTGPLHFMMTLSRDVPVLLASSLPRFVSSLCAEAGLDWKTVKENVILAVHPGGPRIIELSQKILGATPNQVRFSRQILRDHGNMSSATLPHIWKSILEDRSVPDGTPIISLGAGPGLTLSGMLFRKM